MTTTADSTLIREDVTGAPFNRAVAGQVAALMVDVNALGASAVGVYRPVDAAANTATAETTLFEAQSAKTITAIKLCADGAVVASDTDYLTITIKQRDGAGGSASTIATATSKVTGGVAIASFTKVSLGTLTNAALAAGAIVTITVAKSGAGKALPTHAFFFEFA